MKIICKSCLKSYDLKYFLCELPKELGIKMPYDWRGELKGQNLFRALSEKLGFVFGLVVYALKKCPNCVSDNT